jgi:rSAM/selenodomain-associated transferase 1
VNRTLVIFLRAPKLGQVKTRLGAEIGPIKAVQFYRQCVNRTIQTLGDRRWTLEIACTPDGAKIRAPATSRPQGRGDLGIRMARALDRKGVTLVIGTDIPHVTRAHIARAFRALNGAEVVLGPAKDGGYWLIGARGPGRLRLAPVRWSTAFAFQDTLAALHRTRVAIVDQLGDVDTRDDYDALIRNGGVRRGARLIAA